MNLNCPDNDAVSLGEIARVDKLRDRFEEEWQKESVPSLVEFLADGTELSVLLVRELVLLDLDYRTRHGLSPAFEEYCRTFPQFAETIESLRPLGSNVFSATSEFRILDLHKEGGLGQVYLAHDLNLKRRVALKQIRENSGNINELRQRFAREAEITARLQHPGIVPIVTVHAVERSWGAGRPAKWASTAEVT
jgi:serine/threonine protein kinase